MALIDSAFFGEVDPEHPLVAGGVQQVVELLTAGVDPEPVDHGEAAAVAEDEDGLAARHHG